MNVEFHNVWYSYCLDDEYIPLPDIGNTVPVWIKEWKAQLRGTYNVEAPKLVLTLSQSGTSFEQYVRSIGECMTGDQLASLVTLFDEETHLPAVSMAEMAALMLVLGTPMLRPDTIQLLINRLNHTRTKVSADFVWDLYLFFIGELQ